MTSDRSRGVMHLALFRPAPGLPAAEREALVTALRRALSDIALIRRARIARRRLLGRLYDQGAPPYEYLVLLEFASEADLRAYLDHPAHDDLGRHFYESADAAAAFDFEEMEL